MLTQQRTSPGGDSIRRLRQNVEMLDSTFDLPGGMQGVNLGRRNSGRSPAMLSVPAISDVLAGRNQRPAAPSPPTSPNDSIPPLSPSSSNSYSRGGRGGFRHWAISVFENMSATSLPTTSARYATKEQFWDLETLRSHVAERSVSIEVVTSHRAFWKMNSSFCSTCKVQA